MDKFESLKQEWQSQEYDEPEYLKKVQKRVSNQVYSEHRKMVFSSLFVSVSFAAVFVVIGWIWSNNPSRSLYFDLSLTAVICLLLVTLAGFWASVMFKSENSYSSTKKYLTSSIRKIKIRRFMIDKFMPVYLGLLLLCFYFYYVDIFQDASVVLTISGYVGTSLFIGIVYLIARKKRKAQVSKMDRLIRELKEWQQLLG